MDRYLEKHISPQALSSRVKINPLFPAQRSEDAEDGGKARPSWTLQDYRAHTCANLADGAKVRGQQVRPTPTGDASTHRPLPPQDGEKSPRDLDFWLEDVYTPGYDALLRKTEAQLRRRSRCRVFGLAVASVGALLAVVVIPVVLLRRTS